MRYRSDRVRGPITRAARALLPLALAACAPEPRLIEHDLAPGDLVLVVSRPDDAQARRVTPLLVGPSRTVSLSSADDQPSAIVVLPASAMIDEAGAPRGWDEVAVDLEGDRDGGACGCTAPALALPQVVRPGDRCGLPRSVPIALTAGPLPSELEAELRARLRLTWPGACGCPRAPLLSPTRVEVCPLGVGAQRMLPDRLLITDDDAYIAVARGSIAHHAADGTVREHLLEPALGSLTALQVLPDGDALLLSQKYSPLSRSPDLRLVLRGGGSPPIPLTLEADENDNGLTLDGMSWDREQGELWAVGRVGNDLARRPMLARCALDRTGYRLVCDDQRMPIDPACPQHRGREGLVELVHLGGGDRLGLTADGGTILYSGARGQVVCSPRAEPVRVPGASPTAEVMVLRLTAIGRRAVACAITFVPPPARLAVMTATVGPLGPGALPAVRWREVSAGEEGAAYCHEPFADPARPGRIFQPITSGASTYRVLEITETGTAARVHASASALFGGVEGEQLEITSGVGHLGARTARGELLDLDGGQAVPRATLPVDGSSARTVRAIAARPGGGFEVDLGGAQPLVVEAGGREGCDDLRVVAPPGALSFTDTEVDARARLGTRTLRALRDGGAAALEVYEGAQRVRTLSLEAQVTRVVELIPDRWALLLDARGLLWATDGERVERLAHDTPMVALDVAGGVGWAAGNDSLARIQVGPGGRPLLEEGLLTRAGVDGGMLAHGKPSTPSAIGARCGGRALLATRDFPFIGDGAVAMWWIEPTADGLVVRPYEVFDAKGNARPVGNESINGISGSERAPLLFFSGDPVGTGLHAPGAPMAALPFPYFSAAAYADGDVLAGGPHGRLALVRLR